MIFRDLERFVHAFLDGDGGHDDDELGEAVALVQLEDRTEIHVGLARAGLHFNREVARGQRVGRWQTVADLNVLQVREDLLVEQRQPVADAEMVLREEPLPGFGGAGRDRELGPTDFLAAKEVADGLDCLQLEVEVGFEMELHVLATLPFLSSPTPPSDRPSAAARPASVRRYF